MRKYVLHIAFFLALALLLIAGVVGNMGAVGAFFGAMLAMATDPLLVVGALLVGVFVVRQLWFMACAVILAIVLSVYIAYINAELGAQLNFYMVFVRLIAILAIALIVNAVRIAVTSTAENTAKSSEWGR